MIVVMFTVRTAGWLQGEAEERLILDKQTASSEFPEEHG